MQQNRFFCHLEFQNFLGGAPQNPPYQRGVQPPSRPLPPPPSCPRHSVNTNGECSMAVPLSKSRRRPWQYYQRSITNLFVLYLIKFCLWISISHRSLGEFYALEAGRHHFFDGKFKAFCDSTNSILWYQKSHWICDITKTILWYHKMSLNLWNSISKIDFVNRDITKSILWYHKFKGIFLILDKLILWYKNNQAHFLISKYRFCDIKKYN